jgi:DNA mismatch repair protein MutS2
VGSDYIQSDKYLQDIVRDKRYWETKRKNVHLKEKELDDALDKYRASAEELRRSRKEVMREAREEAERLIKGANAKIENTIRAIVEAKAEKERTRQARQELSDFSKQLEELAKQKLQMQTDREMAKILARQERKKNGKQQKAGSAPAAADNKPQHPERKQPKIEVGMYVRIAGQQAIGEVMSLAKNSAIVRFGAIKSTVAISRLQPSEAPKEEVRKVSFLSSETQEQLHNKRLNFKEDIDIRGMRGEEAVQTVGYFLDDAVVCNVHRLRILHGTGNGILRTLVRQYLSTLPFVKHFHDEHVQFGGAGITVVELE